MSAEMDVEGLARSVELHADHLGEHWYQTATRVAATLRQQAEEIARLKELEHVRYCETNDMTDEIVALTEERDALTRQLQEAVEERDRLKELLAPWLHRRRVERLPQSAEQRPMSAEMDVEGLYLCACHEFYDSHHPECPALRQYRQQAEEVERLKREAAESSAAHREKDRGIDEVLATLGRFLRDRESLTRQLQEAVEERDRYRRELESIQRFTAGHAAFTAEGQIHKSVCAALTERSNDQ